MPVRSTAARFLSCHDGLLEAALPSAAGVGVADPDPAAAGGSPQVARPSWASGNAPSDTITISGFLRSRSASAAAPSARVRSAGASDGLISSITLRSRGASLVKRDSGVAWPSTRMIIATSLPPIESTSSRARRLAASMRGMAGASSLSAPSDAFIDADASISTTTLRASRGAPPSVGSSAAARISPSTSSAMSSDIQRLSCFHSALASRCSSTRRHSAENGTSKRRRRILRM
jgi:hypothetical protein